LFAVIVALGAASGSFEYAIHIWMRVAGTYCGGFGDMGGSECFRPLRDDAIAFSIVVGISSLLLAFLALRPKPLGKQE
jgi:hypothetical protein